MPSGDADPEEFRVLGEDGDDEHAPTDDVEADDETHHAATTHSRGSAHRGSGPGETPSGHGLPLMSFNVRSRSRVSKRDQHATATSSQVLLSRHGGRGSYSET